MNNPIGARCLRTLAAALMVVALPLSAQAPKEAPPIDVRFRCLAWKFSPQVPLEFFSGGKWNAIVGLNTFHRSVDPYHYVGQNPAVFYMRDQAGERLPVCEVDFSGNYLEPLLLFTQTPRAAGEGPRYHAVLFEDHDSRFPPGSFQFVNMSRMALNGKIGEATFQLDAGRQMNLKPNIADTRRAVHFLLATREGSGETRILQSTYMQYDSDTKHLTFVLPHPNGRGNVNTFTITQQKREDQARPAP
jgi:hypothetical protein